MKQCCICGGEAHWKQWRNRDDGFWICSDCAKKEKEILTKDEMISHYGKEGLHYIIKPGILHRSNLRKPITFGQLVDRLVELKRKHGILASTPIAYCHDDEGNMLQYVIQLPTLEFSNKPAKFGEYINPDTDLSDEPVGERFICIN